MEYQITKIRLADATHPSTDEITEVKLADGSVETIKELIRFLDSDYEYFYVNSAGKKAAIEAVHDSILKCSIQTKDTASNPDALLSLPQF